MSSTNNLEDRIDSQIESLLNDIAKEEGLKDYRIEKTVGSMRGDGYLGVMTAVSIVENNDSKQGKVLHLIVKGASKSDALRAEVSLSLVFEREIYMYNTVIPTFCELEEEKGLEAFSGSARCYKVCTVEKSEALIFENLKENDYSLWEKKTPMEHDHVSLVMKEFGHFHAVSLAMRDQQPDKFRKLTENMFDIFVMCVEQADFIKSFHKLCVNGLESLDSLADNKSYNIFKTFVDEELCHFIRSLPKLVDNYSVILHGDCWTNNMMFKYEDTDNPKKPTKVCLFDLQISRLGPPVLDLSYFLFGCGSKKVIDNLNHYLDIYFESLSTHLRKLGSNSEDVYPYSIFQKQWRKYSRFGLICSMLLLHVMLSKQEETIDFTELADSGKKVGDAFNYNIANVEDFNDRARHIILHFIENGLI